MQRLCFCLYTDVGISSQKCDCRYSNNTQNSCVFYTYIYKWAPWNLRPFAKKETLNFSLGGRGFHIFTNSSMTWKTQILDGFKFSKSLTTSSTPSYRLQSAAAKELPKQYNTPKIPAISNVDIRGIPTSAIVADCGFRNPDNAIETISINTSLLYFLFYEVIRYFRIMRALLLPLTIQVTVMLNGIG